MQGRHFTPSFLAFLRSWGKSHAVCAGVLVSRPFAGSRLRHHRSVQTSAGTHAGRAGTSADKTCAACAEHGMGDETSPTRPMHATERCRGAANPRSDTQLRYCSRWIEAFWNPSPARHYDIESPTIRSPSPPQAPQLPRPRPAGTRLLTRTTPLDSVTRPLDDTPSPLKLSLQIVTAPLFDHLTTLPLCAKRPTAAGCRRELHWLQQTPNARLRGMLKLR